MKATSENFEVAFIIFTCNIVRTHIIFPFSYYLFLQFIRVNTHKIRRLERSPINLLMAW